MGLKRLLFLSHRWLGIILCLFMALWFVSGVVMMYVGYPKLTTAERLAAAPPLETGSCCIAGAAIGAKDAKETGLRSLRLINAGGEPRFVASASRSSLTVISAVSGELVAATDATQVRAIAAQFARGAPVMDVIQVEEDAWTHSRALDPFRPLWRASVQDPNLAYVYVSGRTGEVVRDVTTTERNWNWIGAWLHWLYPLRGGWLDRWWADIVIYLSLIATVLAVTGLVIGILRWRFQPYRSGSRSPYRNNMMRWHHWGGLFFGVLAVTWIASGLFSMNPWKIFSSDVPKMPESRIPAPAGVGEDAGRALRCFASHGYEARELEWRRLGDDVLIEGRNASGGLLLLRANGQCEPRSHVDPAAVEREAERLMPHARKLAVRVQQEYDWSYYARAVHSMTGHFEKPLPVLVVEFDDPHATTLYMDLRNGRLVQRLDTRGRVKRWLFAFFHSWDWLPLLDRRPLWDVLLIAGSIGGLLISLTGIVIGWRRLIR
jgi:uncharacterized iron-regulated membrane protein